MIDKRKAERIYRKSIDVLKDVQLRNGGCLATPKGERYPYVYPRDHAVILLGFLSAGRYDRVKKGLEFALLGQYKNGAFPQRYDMDGRDASYKPIQIDGTALMIIAFVSYYKKMKDKAFLKKHWKRIEKGLQYIISNIDPEKELVFTPNSVHEFPPMEAGLEIWANALSCAALREAGDIALDITGQPSKDLFDGNSHTIWKGIVGYLYNSRVRSFIKNIRLKESSSVETEIDGGVLALCDYGIIGDKESMMKLTIKRLERELWNKKLGGLCRYPKYEGRNNGGWGPWPHFTLMLARHYVRLKDKRNADRCINWCLKITYKDFFPEQGNFENICDLFDDEGW